MALLFDVAFRDSAEPISATRSLGAQIGATLCYPLGYRRSPIIPTFWSVPAAVCSPIQ